MMDALFVTKVAVWDRYQQNVHSAMELENTVVLLRVIWNCILASASIWTGRIAVCVVRSVITAPVTIPN